MPTNRTLHLRPSSVQTIAQAGAAPWDNPSNVLLEDGLNGTIDMSLGIDGPKLQVLMTPVGEELYPAWAVSGLEVRVRGACIGNTNPALSAPILGLRVLPGSGNLYASQERVAPLQYLATATDWLTLGGPGDLWGIPTVYSLAKDAATIGLMLEVDPKPWAARSAQIALDVVEIVLYLQAEPFGDLPLDPSRQGPSRTQQARLLVHGQEPVAPIQPGAIVGNHLEEQLWFGAPDGTPVAMISFRGGYSNARRYHPGQVVTVGNQLYRCLVEKAAGAPFLGASWEALS